MIQRINGSVCNFIDFGVPFCFFVSESNDLIQKHHYRGELYEHEELDIIRKNCGDSKVFFDIGSNVGNHALFFVKVLKAASVVVFEANPKTADLLKLNISLNNSSHTINQSYLSIGLGAKIGICTITYPQSNNIGASKLLPKDLSTSDQESIPIVPLDHLNIITPPDFIKIDVEGMEMEVLLGARNLINTYRPIIFVEVDSKNSEDFHRWLSESRYEIREQYQRYISNVNYLIVPKK
jgi:FkbM family methyltransferase